MKAGTCTLYGARSLLTFKGSSERIYVHLYAYRSHQYLVLAPAHLLVECVSACVQIEALKAFGVCTHIVS